jgi:poly(A) polymerase
MATDLHSNPQYRAALAIVWRLREAGHEAYFAGGCVRDLLLGATPKDFDVATSATPDKIVALFAKTFTVGAHFGVVLVCQTVDEVEITTEVATFRNDGAYSDGRRPDAVRFSTDAREDVLRRDFTINGMLMDPLAKDPSGAILDFVGGRKDLSDHWIRTIGIASDRFAEDKLRMLRAVRFAARLSFAIYYPTAAAINKRSAEIVQVSVERIREELNKMLTDGHARRAFQMLEERGLLVHILPEVVRLRGVAQPPEFHPEGDVWTHTMLMLEQLPAGCSTTLAWGALLHDIGKPATYQPPAPDNPSDRIRFNGHVEVGARIAETTLARLRFSNDDTAQIVALVRNHMRFGDVMRMKQATLKRFLRLPRFEEHLALHRMDSLSAHGDLTNYNYAREQFEAEPAEELRPAPLVTGRDLIAAGYHPSPQFKAMLLLAEDAQLDGTATTREEALRLVTLHFPLAPR